MLGPTENYVELEQCEDFVFGRNVVCNTQYRPYNLSSMHRPMLLAKTYSKFNDNFDIVFVYCFITSNRRIHIWKTVNNFTIICNLLSHLICKFLATFYSFRAYCCISDSFFMQDRIEAESSQR